MQAKTKTLSENENAQGETKVLISRRLEKAGRSTFRNHCPQGPKAAQGQGRGRLRPRFLAARGQRKRGRSRPRPFHELALPKPAGERTQPGGFGAVVGAIPRIPRNGGLKWETVGGKTGQSL